MKNVVIVVALLLAFGATAYAEEAVPEGPQFTVFTKLGRGIKNIVVAPIEIPVSVFNVAADTDFAVGLTAGTLAGLVSGVERIACGGIDICTCLFPPYDRPLISYELGKAPVVQAAISAFPQEF